MDIVRSDEIFTLRPIVPSDNDYLRGLIRRTLREYGLSGEGTVDTDPELDDLCGAFSGPDRGYWVVVRAATGEVIGGGGFAPLKGTGHAVYTCEFQKTYLEKSFRGMGLGAALLDYRMVKAKEAGFVAGYMETIEEMASVPLFASRGFYRLDAPLGTTGHSRLTVFMYRNLI